MAFKIRHFVPWLLTFVVALLVFQLRVAGQGDFPDLCQQGQLLHNCDFSQGLNGWQPFIEGGDVGISTIDGGACHSPLCPAAFLVSKSSFIAGVYQQVPAVPGTTYWATVTWLVFEPAGKLDNTVGRRVGIDPSGGTDPKSSSIVWSPALWDAFESCAYKICSDLQVKAVAQNSTITVFVRIENTWKDRRDEFASVPDQFFQMEEQFWLDDVGLVAVDGGAAAAAAAPTDTPLPPTPAPPTDTPAPPAAAPTATAEATEPPAAAPTATAGATEPPAVAQADTPAPAPPTSTATPSPTPSPTSTPRPPTPTPTHTPAPTATPTPAPALPNLLSLVGGGVVCLGGAGTLIILVGGAFLFWLYRLGTSAGSEEEEDEALQEPDTGEPEAA
jgi:hypothetical protein